jgi:hypothetical protein
MRKSYKERYLVGPGDATNKIHQPEFDQICARQDGNYILNHTCEITKTPQN